MTHGKRPRWWIAPWVLLVIPLAAPAQTPYQTREPIKADELRQLLTKQEKNAQLIEGELFLTYSVEDLTIPAPLLVDEMLKLQKKWLEGAPAHLNFVFTNCIIKDDLSFAKQKISVGMKFNNVHFEGKVNFFRATFGQRIWLENNCRFKQEVTLSEAKFSDLLMGSDDRKTVFEGDVWAVKAQFGTTRFDHGDFHKAAKFEGAKFAHNASFRNASFSADANFHEAVFSGYATFRSASIDGQALFGSAVFEKESNFTHARFKYQAGFVGVHFKERADFSAAQFAQANFSDAVFHGVASFNHANFSRLVLFEFTRFDGEADFEACTFPDKMQAAHQLASRGVYFSETRFEKRTRLAFDQLVSGTYRMPFSNPETKVLKSENDVRVWESLSQTFERSGDLSSHNEAEYQKQLAYARLPGTSLRDGARNRFWRFLWGYGVRPWRVALWIVISYVGFAGLYWTQAWKLAPLERIKFSALFSWRTAYRLFYGWENSLTWTFGIITMVQAVGTKILAYFFFKSLANTSPLVSEIINKVMP